MKKTKKIKNNNNSFWIFFNFVVIFFCIVLFWVLGPSYFPDYPNYINAANYGYNSFFEYIPQYFLTNINFIHSPETRINFYFALTHAITFLTFITITTFYPKTSFMQALFFSFYLPFFITTALRASIAYIIAGILVPIMINSKKNFLALILTIFSCFFHDSGVFSILMILTFSILIFFKNLNFIRYIKLTIGLIFIFSFFGNTLDLDINLFPDIGRFNDYFNDSLNSISKLLYIYIHIGAVILMLKNEIISKDLQIFFLIGSLGISIVGLVNHVAAIRLLPYIMGPGFLIIGEYLKKTYGSQVYIFAPIMLVYLYINFIILLF